MPRLSATKQSRESAKSPLTRSLLIEWLLLGGALLVLAASMTYNLIVDYQDIDRHERERLALQAKVVHDNLSRQLAAINLALTNIVSEWADWNRTPDGMDHADNHLKAFADVMPGVRTINILDAEGFIRASSRPELRGQNFRERDYFQTPQRQPDPDRLYIGRPFRTALGVWTLNVVRMIPGPHGEFAGIVSATLNPGEFKILLDSVRYAPDMWSTVAHSDGEVFLTMPEPPGANAPPPIPLNWMTLHRSSGRLTDVVRPIDPDTGLQRLLALHTVQSSVLHMDKSLMILVGRDLAAIHAPWFDKARLLGGLFVLLIGIAVPGLHVTQRRRRIALGRAAAADAALREKNAELERFFSVSLDLLCIADMDGRFRKLNPAWERVLGYRLDELEGAFFLDFVHPQDIGATLETMTNLSGTQAVSRFTNRYRTRNGDYRFIEWYSVPYEDRLIYAAARDITERRQTEQALADRERFMRSLIDILPGMVGYWHADLRCGFANIGYREWFGRSPEVMQQITLPELLGETLFAQNEPFIRAALQGKTQHFERTLTKADGSTGYTWAHYIPDVVGGKVQGFFVLVSDITEIKQAELALREALAQAERFREALDHVSSFIYMKDRDHRYVYANQPTLDLFGVTAEELAGTVDTQFFPPDAAVRLHEVDERVLAGARTEEEIDVTDEQGGRRVYWEVKTPIYADSGRTQIWGLCGISTDITTRKLQEEEFTRARIAAEAASRAKSAFLANMSHEIRTPMNAVLGLLQLLRHTDLSARQLDYARKAETAAQSLLAILNDILDFSKVEAGKLVLDETPFRLDDLLRNLSVVLSAALSNREIEVLFKLDPGIPRVLRGDALRLQQVLLNLAGNAIKFTERGEVIVSLHALEIDPTQARIAFAVSDTGIGIPSDRLHAIFEGFTQAENSTTRRYGGTGLGLAICQRLVDLMGGELTVESTPGVGSRFGFTLDFARDAETLAHEHDIRQVSAPLAPAHPLRVLIVDDNAIAREIMTGMVESFGWQAETAAAGTEALDLLEREARAGRGFDVICIDRRMPELDGWETIQRIRALALDPVPSIIMVTAHGSELPEDRPSADTSLLDGFLIKPVTPSMLFDAVANATGRRPALEPPASARPGSARLAGLRLLVVEDNPLNRQVAQELLMHQGAEVEVAHDGRQGIARIGAAQPPFDLVLMDLQMPDLDGFQATRILREEMGLTELPIIAMTANALASDRAACLAAGMNDHVGKPIEIEQLVAAVLRQSGRAPVAARPLTGTPADTAMELPTGLALVEALARLDHDRALFASLARRFAEDQGEVVRLVRQALLENDRETATRALHTLKGVAGALGAVTLAQAAALVERRLQAGTTPAEAEELLAGLQEHLHETISLLQEAAATLAPPADTPSATPTDPAHLAALLTELEILLGEHNMRAIALHATLKREYGAAFGEQLAALDDAMGRLDFPCAREIATNLKDRLAA